MISFDGVLHEHVVLVRGMFFAHPSMNSIVINIVGIADNVLFEIIVKLVEVAIEKVPWVLLFLFNDGG